MLLRQDGCIAIERMTLGSGSDHELLLLGQASAFYEKLSTHLIGNQHIYIYIYWNQVLSPGATTCDALKWRKSLTPPSGATRGHVACVLLGKVPWLTKIAKERSSSSELWSKSHILHLSSQSQTQGPELSGRHHLSGLPTPSAPTQLSGNQSLLIAVHPRRTLLLLLTIFLPIMSSLSIFGTSAVSSCSRHISRLGVIVSSSSSDGAPFSTSSFRWSWRRLGVVFQNLLLDLLLEELHTYSGPELPLMESTRASRVDVRTRLGLLRCRAKGRRLVPQSCKGHWYSPSQN